MCDEVFLNDVESLRLPKGWHSFVRNAALNVFGIVRIAMLRKELRINGARMQRSRRAPTSPIHTRRADGHPAVAGRAWLEQNRDGSPLLCIRRHRPSVAATCRGRLAGSNHRARGRLLDPLDPERYLATVARLLVGAECDRSFLTAVDGVRRVQVLDEKKSPAPQDWPFSHPSIPAISVAGTKIISDQAADAQRTVITATGQATRKQGTKRELQTELP